MATMQRHWDIFCRVIDNFGDIGVCWRLARQLTSEHQRLVRLWVDDLNSLKPLCPEISAQCDRQQVAGVEIRHWTPSSTVDRVADVVIEAFACDLPEAYIQRMAQADNKPCWINLEYLTAESWAESCHGLASPHPSLPLVKHFYFPGFTARSGGLLREHGAMAAEPAERCSNSPEHVLKISLFSYDTAPVGELLDTLAARDSPTECLVPPGKPLAAVERHFGKPGPWLQGTLRITPIPFLPLDEYDQLLRQCDVNFVRGEDSFLRAQWAAHAFVWQIYKQDEDAHLVKLDAFLDRYTAKMPDEALKSVCRTLFHAWNSGLQLEPALTDFLAHRQQFANYNREWRAELAEHPDLASALVKFCSAKV